MSAEINWKQWEPGDKALEELLQPARLHRLHSKNPLVDLKRQLLYSLFWGVGITIGYFLLLPYIHSGWVIAGFVIMILFNLFLLYTTIRLYQRVQPDISPKANLLEELRRHDTDFKQWWDIQRRVALFVYPVAVSAGFVFGGMMGSGKTVTQLFSRPVFSWTLLICIVVLVPLCLKFAHWMFEKSFGKHLKILRENIKELSQD